MTPATSSDPRAPRTSSGRARWLLPLLAVLCLVPGGRELPGVTLPWPSVPAWAALVVGIALALVVGHPHAARTTASTPKLLAASVVGLGAAMDLRQVGRVGAQGIGYTAAGIALALALGMLLARLLGVRRNTALLIAIGTAICGGSAIAAAAPVLGAEDEDVSMALVIVFVLNATALVLFPLVGHALDLRERPFGLWAALAIHDTSSVVGASSAYGPEALLVATTTKLARALWIVPLTLGLGWYVARGDRRDGAARAKPRRPWFILGFLAAAALVTFVPWLAPAGAWVAALARRGLVLTLFLVGSGISRAALAKVGFRPMLQGVFLWLAVAAGTLGAIGLGWVG
ncbi:MAG: putative sulfate exporter family transporter [Polyangiaceae bacterium]|nr:putative sulfate exporter family transporter [Polyangiaceae bacterium]